MIRKTIFTISLAAILLSALWLYAAPSYEPAITLLFGIAGLLGSYFSDHKDAASAEPILSSQATDILRVAASGNGNIAVFNHPDLKFVDASVNSPQHFRFEADTPRGQAEYIGAIDELVERGFVKYEEGALWRVTPMGFQMADTIK
jgi:hypothetical protein